LATIKFVLKTSQPKKDGTIPILLRVIADRKTKYISTGYAVKQHQFKEGTENWVIKHPDSALINAALELKRSEVAEQSYRADISNKRLDIAALGKKKRVTGTFFAAVTARLDNLENRNQAAMYEKLHAKFKILKLIWRQDVYLEELSKHHVDKYISARLKDKIHVNTIKKELSYFSTVLSEIEHKGVDYFRRAQKNLIAIKGKKQKLTAEDVATMETTTFYGMTEVARDMFLFAYYCHGMRFENVATFQESFIKNGVIRYQMNKGKDTRDIEIHPKLQVIISKYKGNSPYLFPVVKKQVKDIWEKKSIIGSANAVVNTHLKRVAVICGIDKNLTTHINRHTFSYLTLKRGVSPSVIKDALGHSSIKTTETYLESLSDDEINKAVRGLYD
jgi:integrase